MSLSIVYSRASTGIRAPLVTVETHLSSGLPSLNIVGLPETAVKESKDRVRSALLNAGFEFPPRRTTINLAPADLPKEGGRFDLPIALGILSASGQIDEHKLAHCELIGELSLSGELRPIRGVLPIALAAKQAGRTLVVPQQNAAEAALAGGEVLGVQDLLQVCSWLQGQQSLSLTEPAPLNCSSTGGVADLADVKGQPQARRALEIAAAGEHNLLLLGPPGTGKTMLASRLPGLLPSLSDEDALQSAAIWSVSGHSLDASQWKRRPFRMPHHSASGPALVGGGSNPKPGEISLAHNGVLFLDELPEFDRKVLEVLREPLESGKVIISRAARQAEFPARFQLIAAMNPCPCGHFGNANGHCRCTSDQVRRYLTKLSGPFLDRIDMHVEVPAMPLGDMLDGASGEATMPVRERVERARQRQLNRQHKVNGLMAGTELERGCEMDSSVKDFLRTALEKLRLSARAYHRVLRVSRTIADLADETAIQIPHVAEALQYRRMDRLLATL